MLQRLDGPVQPGHIHTDLVGLPLDVSIGVGSPDPAYYAAPFPIDLMVRTNGGTRLIRFDPPPVVTQDDLDRLQAECCVKVGDCQQLVDPWFKLHARLQPALVAAPAQEGLEVLHHWAVVVERSARGRTGRASRTRR